MSYFWVLQNCLVSTTEYILAPHLQKLKYTKKRITVVCKLITYVSWGFQNEFIQICGNLVKSILEVNNTIYHYSIIVDGTADASHTEQITSILR